MTIIRFWKFYFANPNAVHMLPYAEQKERKDNLNHNECARNKLQRIMTTFT